MPLSPLRLLIDLVGPISKCGRYFRHAFAFPFYQNFWSHCHWGEKKMFYRLERKRGMRDLERCSVGKEEER